MKLFNLLVLLLFAGVVFGQNTTTHIENQLIIKFSSTTNKSDWLAEYEAYAMDEDADGNVLVEFDLPVTNDDGEQFLSVVEINNFIRQTASNAEIEDSSLNYEVELVDYGNGLPVGAMDFTQYLPISVAAAANYPGMLACEKGYEGEHKVRIGLIDTGVKTTANNHIGEYLIRNESVISESGEDDNGHGTAVASIIVGMAKRMNISPENLEIVSIKALGEDGRGTLFDLILAIDMAIGAELDILNLSWSYNLANSDPAESNLLKYKLNIFDNQGLIFAAAGNASSDLNTTHIAPAGFVQAYIVTVGGIDSNGQFDAISNYGQEYVNIAAPSQDIVCYSIAENAWVQGEQGTSFASPIAVFHAALYWFKYLEATYDSSPFAYEKSQIDILEMKNFIFGATDGNSYGGNIQYGAVTFDDVCDGYDANDKGNGGNSSVFDWAFPKMKAESTTLNLSFYPNPCTDYVIIELEDEAINESVKIDMIDAIGRTVVAQKQMVNGKYIHIDIQHIIKGSYWMIVEINGQRVTHHFTKE